MKKTDKTNIRQAVRYTLEKHAVRDVTPSNIRRILSALGFKVVRLTSSADSEAAAKLSACGITADDLHGDSRSVCRDGKKYVFIAADADDFDILHLLSRELGYIVLCKPKDGLYGADAGDEAAAEKFAHYIVGITKHSALYNLFFFHPSAVVGTCVALLAAAAGCFALFGSPASVTLPRTDESAERALPVISDTTAAPEAPAVTQEPLQIDAGSAAPVKLDELAGIAAEKQPVEAENTCEEPAEPVVTSGFIPLADDEPLPGFDQSVTESGNVQTESAERTIPSAVPQPSSGSAAAKPAAQAETPPVSVTPSGYVATGSGAKYHTPDCSYVKGKSTHSVSIEDINAGKYTACSRCIK